MTRFGYTLMTEQSGPKDLVRYAQKADQIGFDFEVSSDHFFPWLSAQGHAPHAWTVLGAVAHVTQHVELYTYVTCPILRYHPVVVAQKAATLQILADGRFTLGLGSGENLNEHVIGQGWPSVDVRQDMLVEAIEIIRQLHTGDLITYDGQYYRVDSARVWDMPDMGVPIGVAAGGPKAIERCGPLADHLIATDPNRELISAWNALDGVHPIGDGSKAVGQIPICWHPTSKDKAISIAHEQFRWFAGGWAVNADLPTTAGFAGATQFVRPTDVAETIACGPDLDEIVEKVRPYFEAGFTDVALVQVGDKDPESSQDAFLANAAQPLLEKLRAAASRSS